MKKLMKSKLIPLLAATPLMWVMVGATPSTVLASGSEHHVRAAIVAVGGSGVGGYINIVQMPGDEGGSRIQVVATGLQPGEEYVSLYYDNSTCDLPGDELGAYTGNAGGIGTTGGRIDDDLDEVDSVSVRVAGTLELLGCADTH